MPGDGHADTPKIAAMSAWGMHFRLNALYYAGATGTIHALLSCAGEFSP